MEENREMVELLKQIEKSGRQRARTGKILCVLALAVAVCCVLTAVSVVRLVPQVSEVIGQAQRVLGNLEQTAEALAAADLSGMVSDVDTLVASGQQSLSQTMEKLNTIDFEALNAAIEDLAAVVEPLSKFFGVFQ